MLYFFFFNDTATTEIYTLSLHDALPIYGHPQARPEVGKRQRPHQLGRQVHVRPTAGDRSEEHTSELQSRQYLVCRLLLEKKKISHINYSASQHTTSITQIQVTECQTSKP